MIMLRYFLLFAVGLLSACSLTTYSWQPISYDSHVVWADDNSELAVGTSFFEQRQRLQPLFGETEKRHFSYRVFLVKSDGTKRHAISTVLPNQLEHLYYMKKAGYLLAESYVEMTGAKQVHKIDLQGNAILIPNIAPLPDDNCAEEDNGNVTLLPQVIPSPNGQLLAHAYRADCQKVTVVFYAADTLATVDQQTLALSGGNYDMTWRKDGVLLVAKTDHSEAWQLSPKQKPTTTTAPACFRPATRSSEVSSTGQWVKVEANDVFVTDIGVAVPFGCQ